MKKICYFGIYDREYSRNKILIRGWKENGYEVVECTIDPKKDRGFKKYIKLISEYQKIKNQKFDFVVVGFPGHSVVWLARALFGKVVFDAFLSLYDSNVYDRRLYLPYSFSAIKDYALDFISVHIAYKVLLDTNEHIEYFSRMFLINKEKCIRVLISADENIFSPIKSNKIKNLVHFHGMFIPLQGIDHILDTAKIMTEHLFRFIGNGQLFEKMKKKAHDEHIRNVEFLGKIDIHQIPKYIAESDVSLGIFGDSEKTHRVIPNKVYEYAAMGVPIVTRDTTAIREVFNDKDMILSKSSQPADIREAILQAQKISSFTCLETYKKNLLPKKLVQNLLAELRQSL